MCGVALAVLTIMVVAGGTDRADAEVLRFVHAHRVGSLTAALGAVTWLGSFWVLAPLSLAVGSWVLARRREAWPLSALATAVVAAGLSHQVLKRLLDRPRPPDPLAVGGMFDGWAFPSGHATQSLAVWGLLAVIASSRLRRRRWLPPVLAGVVVLAVGASRVYLGAHWPSDVVGGFALGGLVLSGTLLSRPFTRT